jgi:hypothetical protein
VFRFPLPPASGGEGTGRYGLNEPAFRLGQRTAEDGLDLARTCPGKPDVLGQRVETIAAAHNGIVLVLHTFARVSQGESLGVILETDREH